MRRSVFALIAIVALEASADIRWLATEYDFGAFKEAAGKQTGTLRFVNEGPEPVAIRRVRPSCGCTAASFTEGEIMPGDTASVSFTYNPAGRPGRFLKNLKVNVDPGDKLTVLRLKGTVIGTPETLSSTYPIEVGPLRLSQDQLIGGELAYGSGKHLMINGYNQSSDTIRPSWKSLSPAITVGISNKAVGPGEIVTFSFYFNSRESNELGFISADVDLFPDGDGKELQHRINFTANVVPDQSKTTPEELAKAPRLEADPEIIPVGVCEADEKKKFSFTIANTGKSDLIVNRIYSRAAGLTITSYPTRLAPGKKAKVEGVVDVAAQSGKAFGLLVDMITNDPVSPVKSVRVSGEIKR